MTMIHGAIAIFRRDMKKFISTPYVIIFTLFMPIMYLIVFGNVIGGTITGIHIGVVQSEPYVTETPLFTASVEALRNFRSAPDKPTIFDVTVYPSEDVAKQAIADSEISGADYLPVDPPRRYYRPGLRGQLRLRDPGPHGRRDSRGSGIDGDAESCRVQ